MDITTQRELFKACKNGDLETLSQLLAPENVNVPWGLTRSEAKNEGIEEEEITVDIPHSSGSYKYNSKTTILHVAAASGRCQITELLLKNDADVFARDWYAATPLHYASWAGAAGVVKLLINYTAGTDALDCDGKTPLHYAAFQTEGHEAAELLLQGGVDLHKKDKLGFTALHNASQCGSAKVVQLLLNHGANIHEKNNEDATPLHLTGKNKKGGLEVAKILIKSGANIDSKANSGRTPLHYVSEVGNAKVVQVLIGHGADIHEKTNIGSSPLHFAGKDKDGGHEVAEMLINCKADINGKNNSGWTPLHLACFWGNAKVVQVLLNHGADIHEVTNMGFAPLHLAGKDKDGGHEVAELLLTKGSTLNQRDKKGKTPLHSAIQYGNTGIAQLLLAHGADVNVTDDEQTTPLLLAMEMQEEIDGKIVQILLDFGADVQKKYTHEQTALHLASARDNTPEVLVESLIRKGADVHDRDDHKRTPLHLATTKRNMSAIEVLVKNGANVHSKDDHNNSPLLSAIKRADTVVIEALIRHGPNTRDEHGCTPLHLAAKHFYQERDAEELLATLIHDVDVDAMDSQGNTPLHYAVQFGNDVFMQALIKYGANCEARTKDNCTPLHLVSKRYGAKVQTEALLRHGADVKVINREGRTPLHLASEEGNIAVMEVLIEHDADVHVWDNRGNTPLHLAGDANVVKLLNKYGAQLNSRNFRKMTPLHSACLHGRHKAATQLLKQGAIKEDKVLWKNFYLHQAAEDSTQPSKVNKIPGRKKWLPEWLARRFARRQDEKLEPVIIASQSGPARHVKRYCGGDYLEKYDGQTPLHLACYGGHFETVNLLLKWGANINATDSGHNTSLHVAAGEGKEIDRGKIVSALLKKGPSVDARNKLGRTPLHLASYRGWHDVIELLVEKGAAVEATDKAGKTPLHLAGGGQHEPWLENERRKVVEVLREGYADLNAKDLRGRTPMHQASSQGNIKFIQLLKEQGAEVNTRDNDNCTPFDLAAAFGCTDVCNVLLQSDSISSVSIFVLGVNAGLHSTSIKFKVNEASTQSPLRPWEDEGVYCESREKLITRAGGKIELPNVTLYIPPKALERSVTVCVTERKNSFIQGQKIMAAGLQEFLRPGMQLELQPHGLKFLQPVHLEMKNTDVDSDASLLVFHKEMGIHGDAPWTDITSDCQVQFKKNDVVLSIDHFSGIETIILLTVGVSSIASVVGFAGYALGLLNNRFVACDFSIYYRLAKPYLEVIAEAQRLRKDARPLSNEAGTIFFGEGVSNCCLIDKENLLFYYDSSHKKAGEFNLILDQCMQDGQYFRVPLSAEEVEELPTLLRIHRSKLLLEQNICEVRRRLTESKVLQRWTTVSLSYQDEKREEKLERLKEYIHHGKEKRDKYITQHYATLVDKMRTTCGLLEVLVSHDVITRREEASISAFMTECDQSKCLIDIVSKVDHDKYLDFLEALAKRQEDLVQFLTDGKWKKPGGLTAKATNGSNRT